MNIYEKKSKKLFSELRLQSKLKHLEDKLEGLHQDRVRLDSKISRLTEQLENTRRKYEKR